MKKIIILVLAVILCLSLLGCDPFDSKIPIEATYIVTEVAQSSLLVAQIGEDGEAIEGNQYSVPNWFYPSTQIEVGYKITISHSDEVLETFPMQFAEIYKMEYNDSETGLSTIVIAD